MPGGYRHPLRLIEVALAVSDQGAPAGLIYQDQIKTTLAIINNLDFNLTGL